MRCAVFGCNSNNKNKNRKEDEKLIRFYSFPKNAEIRSIWLVKCRRKDTINPATARICSKHFDNESYIRNLQHELLGYMNRNTHKLKKDAIPTVELPSSSLAEKTETKRQKRMAARARKSEIKEILEKAIPNEIVPEESKSSLLYDAVCKNCSDRNNQIAVLELQLSVATKQLNDMKQLLIKEKAAKEEAKLCLVESRHENDTLNKQLQTIFTNGQLRKLKISKMTVNWTEDDTRLSYDEKKRKK